MVRQAYRGTEVQGRAGRVVPGPVDPLRHGFGVVASGFVEAFLEGVAVGADALSLVPGVDLVVEDSDAVGVDEGCAGAFHGCMPLSASFLLLVLLGFAAFRIGAGSVVELGKQVGKLVFQAPAGAVAPLVASAAVAPVVGKVKVQVVGGPGRVSGDALPGVLNAVRVEDGFGRLGQSQVEGLVVGGDEQGVLGRGRRGCVVSTALGCGGEGAQDALCAILAFRTDGQVGLRTAGCSSAVGRVAGTGTGSWRGGVSGRPGFRMRMKSPLSRPWHCRW